jgi:multiple sugar transport system ATP-binding protein
MNFFPGQIAAGGARVEGQGVSLDLGEANRGIAGGQDGRDVMVGVRPEHLRAEPREGGGPTAQVQMTIELVETLGHEVLLHGKLGGSMLVAKADPRGSYDIDDVVDLHLELDHVQLFAADTERRLTEGE